jgi:hypothetical protein
MWMMLVPHRRHAYRSPRPVTDIALLIYNWMMFEPHRYHAYGSPSLVTGIASHVYLQMFVPNRKHTY